MRIPPGAIDPAALVGAEAVVPDERAFDRHIARVERLLRRAESIRGFSPAVSPRTLGVFHERLLEDGLEAEVVLTRPIVDYLEREHPDVLADSLAAASVRLYWTEAELPFTLLLVSTAGGGEVCIDFGREGLVTGVLVNDTAESRRWAEAAFAERKRDAEPLAADSRRPD